MVGPWTACLVTLTGRRPWLLVGALCPARTAEAVGGAMTGALAGVAPDRGKDFAGHARVTGALGGVRFYLCEPHRPWQKPTVEDTNGLIGEFFPKGTDFSKVARGKVERAFLLINDRPRRVLGYRTANEAYWEGLLHLA